MTTFAEEKLRLRRDGYTLDIEAGQWREALKGAEPDLIVKIRHAAIKGDASYRFHVAAIPDRVGCHFHAHGNEDYAVVSGEGTLHWGKVTKSGDGLKVGWEEPMPVKTGDSFVIPEGYAHQLRKTGDGDLIILFACPDSHLNDALDRTMIAVPPEPKATAKHPESSHR